MTGEREVFYTKYIARIDTAIVQHRPFEAVLLTAALLEVRIISILRSGEPEPGVTPQMGNGLGGTIKAMRKYQQDGYYKHITDEMLSDLWEWRGRRNELVHDIAKGEIAPEDMDTVAGEIASDGQELLRASLAAFRRERKIQVRRGD